MQLNPLKQGDTALMNDEYVVQIPESYIMSKVLKNNKILACQPAVCE